MLEKEICDKLKKIESSAGDYEAAHSLEDELYVEFIQWIADSWSGSLSTKAKLILKAREIEFSRYCA